MSPDIWQVQIKKTQIPAIIETALQWDSYKGEGKMPNTTLYSNPFEEKIT